MSQPTATLEDLASLLQTESGCAICHYSRQAGRKYLDGVMYESVNDFGLRQQLARTLGFCEFHSRELLTFPGAKLGAAIIEQAMLQEALRRLNTLKPQRRSMFSLVRKGALPLKPPDSAHCPACLYEEAAAQRAIEELLQHWDARWEYLLSNAGGLCFNHLNAALAIASPTMARRLQQMHQRLWQIVIAQLDEFIRKQDYRFRDEIIDDEEGLASRRAIAILTGETPHWSSSHPQTE